MDLQKILAIGIAVVAILCLGTAAQAERRFGGPTGGGPGPEKFLEKHADRLDLDDELRDIVEASAAEAEKRREDLEAAHKAMRELLEAESPDEDAVMKQADVIGALETQRHKHRLATMMKIHALLTPEQRAELREYREERRSRWSMFRNDQMAEACEGDIQTLCPDASGPMSRRHCMREHRDELSEGCREAVAERRGMFRGRHHECAEEGCEHGECPHHGEHAAHDD